MREASMHPSETVNGNAQRYRQNNPHTSARNQETQIHFRVMVGLTLT
jgi:hypothetical protein